MTTAAIATMAAVGRGEDHGRITRGLPMSSRGMGVFLAAQKRDQPP
jgi:hypothetical protein